MCCSAFFQKQVDAYKVMWFGPVRGGTVDVMSLSTGQRRCQVKQDLRLGLSKLEGGDFVRAALCRNAAAVEGDGSSASRT